MTNYDEIYQYLLDNPEALSTDASAVFGVQASTIRARMASMGLRFQDRIDKMAEKREQDANKKWPKIKIDLDTKPHNYSVIAKNNGISLKMLRKLIKSHKYPIEKRRSRIISENNRARKCGKPQISKIRPARKVRVLPHSLPLNELWRAVA